MVCFLVLGSRTSTVTGIGSHTLMFLQKWLTKSLWALPGFWPKLPHLAKAMVSAKSFLPKWPSVLSLQPGLLIFFPGTKVQAALCTKGWTCLAQAFHPFHKDVFLTGLTSSLSAFWEASPWQIPLLSRGLPFIKAIKYYKLPWSQRACVSSMMHASPWHSKQPLKKHADLLHPKAFGGWFNKQAPEQTILFLCVWNLPPPHPIPSKHLVENSFCLSVPAAAKPF